MIGINLEEMTKKYPILERVHYKNGVYTFECSDKKAFDENRIYDFPTTKFTTPVAEIIKMFRNIGKIEPQLQHEYIIPAGINTDGIFKLEGKPLQLVFEEELMLYTDLTGYFSEICKFKTKRVDQLISVYDLFMLRRYDLEKKIGAGNVSVDRIYAEFKTYRPKYASEFNPVWSVAVIKYLSKWTPIEDVLDMSAGRGSRLIGALAAGKTYLASDPNDCVDYDTISNFYNWLNGGRLAQVHNVGFEDINLEGRQFDLMFSSPPYFNLEIYSDTAADSTVKYPEIGTWLDKFLYVSMQKIVSHLRPGGFMCINIDNPIVEVMDYVNPMLKFQFPDAEYMGMFSMSRRVKSGILLHISVWVWRKKK